MVVLNMKHLKEVLHVWLMARVRKSDIKEERDKGKVWE